MRYWPRKFLLRAAFLTGFVALAIAAALRPGTTVETDILALLPAREGDAMLRHAERRAAEGFERKAVLLIGHASGETAARLAKETETELNRSGLFARVESAASSGAFDARRHLYREHLPALLTERQRDMLARDDLKSVRAGMAAAMYGMSAETADALTDPLGLFPEYLAATLPEEAWRFDVIDGVPILSADGRRYAVLRLTLAENPFSLRYQNLAVGALDAAKERLTRERASIVRSGVLFHAAYGAETAKKEIGVMGTTSLAGMAALLVFAFKSFRPVGLSAATVVGGGATGVAACMLLFGKIHLLTLAFGTVIIGITVDYALHFFTQRYNDGAWDANKAAAHIFPGLTLALAANIVGFLGLCAAPFPGLRQMATFCISGLIFVYGFVLLFYPPLCCHMPNAPDRRLRAFASGYMRFWQDRPVRVLCGIALVAFIVGMTALPFLPGKDDVRAMQPLSPALLAQDAEAGKLLGRSLSPQYFVVSGKDDDALVENVEALSATLDKQVVQGALKGYDSVSRFMPSPAAQRSNARALKAFLIRNENSLRPLLSGMGLPASAYDLYLAYVSSKENDTFSLADMMATGDETLNALYIGAFEGRLLAFVGLREVKKAPALADAVRPLPEARFVDKISDLSGLLGEYRYMATLLASAGDAALWLFLICRYGWRYGTAIQAPSALASCLTLTAIALATGGYSLFHVLALFLVTGMGVDYSLFIAEGGKERISSMAAVLLSAAAVLASFGLLATSSTAALRDFGTAVTVGILATLCFLPITFIGRHPRGSQ